MFSPCATTGGINESTWAIEAGNQFCVNFLFIRFFMNLMKTRNATFSFFRLIFYESYEDKECNFLFIRFFDEFDEDKECSGCQQLFCLRHQQGRHGDLSQVSLPNRIISNNNSDLNLCSENSAAAMGLQLTESWVTSTAQAMLPLRMEAALL